MKGKGRLRSGYSSACFQLHQSSGGCQVKIGPPPPSPPAPPAPAPSAPPRSPDFPIRSGCYRIGAGRSLCRRMGREAPTGKTPAAPAGPSPAYRGEAKNASPGQGEAGQRGPEKRGRLVFFAPGESRANRGGCSPSGHRILTGHAPAGRQGRGESEGQQERKERRFPPAAVAIPQRGVVCAARRQA